MKEQALGSPDVASYLLPRTLAMVAQEALRRKANAQQYVDELLKIRKDVRLSVNVWRQ